LALAGCISVPNRDPIIVGAAPLKERAARKGLIIGAEVSAPLLADPTFRNTLTRDFAMVVPGNALKWGPLERRRKVLDFHNADAIADFAAAHGMMMRGHTLLWHDMNPKWLAKHLADRRKDAARLIRRHIKAVAGRYRGRMHSWDVVNEAIEPKDGRGDGLRNSLFLKALGRDYLALAFEAAAKADPGARLVFNEYGCEWGWDVGRQRRYATLRLLEDLLDKGVPVHALGIQGHLDPGSDGSLDTRALGQFCDAAADLGLALQVTELDARDTSIGGSIESRDRLVADAYARFLDVVLARPATEAVLTWGMTDRHSWLTGHFPRPDSGIVRGLPYDADYRRKPAWYALAAALDAAPPRPGRENAAPDAS
jgi:endo-1,4-beta-xylanase